MFKLLMVFCYITSTSTDCKQIELGPFDTEAACVAAAQPAAAGAFMAMEVSNVTPMAVATDCLINGVLS